ncbi:MAG: 50S ribosomal protein L6 [Candidatus Diapherotrites archaeon]|nr:50S ribosomal protein L6 [Candidatus Diapherotrites archaeon]
MKNQTLETVLEIPEGISIQANGMTVELEGKGKKNSKTFTAQGVTLSVQGNQFKITAARSNKKGLRFSNTIYAHVNNMIQGLQKGYEYKLTAVYSHFPMNIQVKGSTVEIHNFIGQKEIRKARIMPGTEVSIKGKDLTVKGHDLEAVGQTAANIENATRLTGKDLRVFQDGVYILKEKR